MGCAKSTINQELPEKLNWTRPDFDELCSKGENSLKLLNELKNGVIASWDRIASKFPLHSITPDLVYLLLLIGFSYESKGDYISIDLHLAQTLPGFSKIHSNIASLSNLLHCWEEFCSELLASVPRIHAIQEDIIQTASVYYQVMSERSKGEKDELDNEVEDAVKQNLKILANGADFFHSVMNKVMTWVEKLCDLFARLDDGKVARIHAFARSLDSLNFDVLLEKQMTGLKELV